MLTYQKDKYYDLNPPMSGIVIIMMGVLMFDKSIDVFDNEVHTIAARCTSNSLKFFDHHGTKGFNYLFGNKPFYGNYNGSSVSTYMQLKTKTRIIKRR